MKTFDDIRVCDLDLPARCSWCGADGVFLVLRRSLLTRNMYGDPACKRCSHAWIHAGSTLRYGFANAFRKLSLTPAQIRLADALFNGQSVAAYAQETGISINTARWHVKQLYKRLGVHRQTELMHFLVKNIVPRQEEFIGADDKPPAVYKLIRTQI